ncbi:uncharacterized protein LOC143293149 [Babylonia areolata]|uniref:uncharacterized protein LOC143293149 n=1 Tax=Babylonia areolata TaxID=304850 RepID=UPI003FCFD0B6
MASGGSDETTEDSNTNMNNAPDSKDNKLEDFIASQLAEQSISRGPGENIDEEKMNRFLSRALSESRRMNQEVAKSEAKMNKLHAELGADRLTQWRQEHSAEVLTPQQSQLVEMTHEKE